MKYHLSGAYCDSCGASGTAGSISSRGAGGGA